MTRQRDAIVLTIGVMALLLGAWLGATGDGLAGPVLVIGVIGTLNGVWNLARPRKDD